MRVLVAPLDWGLGHATRCVPVIREFLAQGADVELAVVKANAGLFREIFPQLRQRVAPGYGIVYPKHGFNMALWLLKNSAHLNAVMRYERKYAEEMVERHGYDVLFSDNRFAFCSDKAFSVYMTHQMRIAFPSAFSAFEGVGIRWHAQQMKKFDEVWIPDLPDFPGYAGSLSHLAHGTVPAKFVGVLSRFSCLDGAAAQLASADSSASAAQFASADSSAPRKYRVMAVVSGVEPARSRFENALRETLSRIPGRHLVVLGKPSSGVEHWTEGNIELYSHLPTAEFAAAVRSAEWVVSRGGYSTVMDMAVLGAKCVFVPTPGQYEQVALARSLSANGFAVHVDSADLSAETLAKAFESEVKLPPPPESALLKSAVSGLFEKIKSASKIAGASNLKETSNLKNASNLKVASNLKNASNLENAFNLKVASKNDDAQKG